MLQAYLISIGLIPGTSAYEAKFREYWGAIFANRGSMAAFFGYDALYLANRTFYVGLNRAMLALYDGTLGDWQNDRN
jgi:hypothetical protein